MYFTLSDQIADASKGNFELQAGAFIRGIWLDNVIACYISILPLVLITICTWFNYYAKWQLRFSRFFILGLYFIAFLTSIANIPYFEYFFKVINSSIFNWIGYGNTTFGMLSEDMGYVGYFIVFVLVFGVFYYLNRHLYYNLYFKIKSINPSPWRFGRFLATFLIGCGAIGACMFGIRGRMGYNPIKISAAYYCKDAFLNQLGINPAFNLLTSALDDARKENEYLRLMPEEKALANVRQFLQRPGIANISPIACQVNSPKTPCRKNVVLVFMESMSAKLMQHFGQPKKLTPFLDSLFDLSLSFSNIYSAGIHTNHGLYATLYSFPAVMKRNAMKGSAIPRYSGLPTVLKDNGYHTLFFMTHESQYDNMNAFLRTNGYDDIYAQENYPKNKVVNSFGVQDDFLYEFALNKINQASDQKKPFFATILSISNHPPYVIPPFFVSKYKQAEDQIVEYADWAISEFMDAAKKQKWFDNTIFVFVADHGKMVGKADCEMPESYNHIPLMIYNKHIHAQVDTCWGGQIDIAPTLLGILGVDYTQLNFGINLLKDNRPCTFYTADNMIGARNGSHMYIHAPENEQDFYYTFDENRHPAYVNADSTHLLLKEYCFSMLQATEYLVKNGKTITQSSNNK